MSTNSSAAAASPPPNSTSADGQDTTTDALYMTIVISVKMLLAAITVLTAGSLVYVTAKSKNLRGSCNLLLAANSLCILLYSFSFFVQFGAILSAGPSGFSNRLCVLLQAIPKVGNYGQYVFFVLIAVDRLIAVIFPVWQNFYLQKHKTTYVSVLFSLGFGYGLSSMGTSIYAAYTSSDKIAVCETGSSALQIFSDLGMALSISACVAYLSLWVIFQLRKNKEKSIAAQSCNDYTGKLLRSLMAMFVLEFFGWSSNQIATKVLNLIGPPPLQRWYIKSYVGYLTQTTLALYAPLLYGMSGEYRKALQKVFAFLPLPQPKSKSNVTAVKSVQQQMATTQTARGTRADTSPKGQRQRALINSHTL